MPIYKPVSAEPSMDSTVYESKRNSHIKHQKLMNLLWYFIIVLQQCMELKIKRRC